MIKKSIILLYGPTVSGKSKLAVDIAKKFNGEIINADSMQIYKEVKILSARPIEEDIKHHLYGFISVKKNFSVGIWHNLAAKKIKEVMSKRRKQKADKKHRNIRSPRLQLRGLHLNGGPSWAVHLQGMICI